jgi:predicted Zn finger-like uncharacterized protein
MVTLVCPSCQKSIRAQDAALGKKVPCPACGTPFVATAAPGTPRLPDTVKMTPEQMERLARKGRTTPPPE